MLLVTGCSHEQLDWRNAEVSGHQIFKRGSDKPFTGDVTNIPDSILYSWVPSFDMSLALKLHLMFEGMHNQTYCHGYAAEGRADGEFVCERDGKSYTRINFKNGVTKGEFKLYALDYSLDHPLLEGSLNNGWFVGKFTQYAKDGSVMQTWDFPQR